MLKWLNRLHYRLGVWTRGAQGTIYWWTHGKGHSQGVSLGYSQNCSRSIFSALFGSGQQQCYQSTVVTFVARYFQLNSFILLLSATESHPIAHSPRANKWTENNIHLPDWLSSAPQSVKNLPRKTLKSRGNEGTERSGVHDEEQWTKERALGDTAGGCVLRRQVSYTFDTLYSLTRCVYLYPLFFFKFLVFEATLYANKDV